MGPNDQEQEILNVIDGLRKSMAIAEKQLEEIRKPKVRIKHGDTGFLETRDNVRVFFRGKNNGELIAKSEFSNFTWDEIKEYVNGGRYTITGNIFK